MLGSLKIMQDTIGGPNASNYLYYFIERSLAGT
jgi:hypothetical protein